MDGVGWHGLIGNQDNYRRVTYPALAALTPKARREQVQQVCRAAGIRMPEKKADYILGCFDYVQRLGGPEAAKARLLAERGREAKIGFLQTFPGIGPKYARNMMMDVYHEDFRDSIALDVRILAISEALGLSFPTYAAHEQFYLAVARDAGLNGWELDRLLFNFRPEVESRLGVNLEGSNDAPHQARRHTEDLKTDRVSECRRASEVDTSASNGLPIGGGGVLTDEKILRVWSVVPNQTYTEARVFACAISACENNAGEIETRRATAVMCVVWPQKPVLGAVLSEIRGNTGHPNNNRNRRADFRRLVNMIRSRS